MMHHFLMPTLLYWAFSTVVTQGWDSLLAFIFVWGKLLTLHYSVFANIFYWVRTVYSSAANNICHSFHVWLINSSHFNAPANDLRRHITVTSIQPIIFKIDLSDSAWIAGLFTSPRILLPFLSKSIGRT